FSCDIGSNVEGGYYADPGAECQAFHICLTTYSFLCPNGTLFNQQYFICDWWFNFDCSTAEGLYSINDEIAAEREAATQALLASSSNNQNS
ncbi:Putative LOC100168286, partial [Caligus rogercresseyi]